VSYDLVRYLQGRDRYISGANQLDALEFEIDLIDKSQYTSIEMHNEILFAKGGLIVSRLQKIKKTTLSDQVCKIIKEKIKTGEWAADCRIPSENELAETFGVNRLTVRNALQKLNAMGIVETRAGEGTYVRKFDFSEYIREVSDLVMSPEILEGVMEFRKCIELECVRLAILRASDQDIEELEDVYKQYEAKAHEHVGSFEKHIDEIIYADLDYHYQICKISKNQLFTIAFDAVREPMYQFIKSVFVKRYKSSKEPKRAFEEAVKDHRLILDSIKKRDCEACEKVYMSMIDFHH
jgi:GntR family transcriptional repressor for pyruvate dehydrogenase complex